MSIQQRLTVIGVLVFGASVVVLVATNWMLRRHRRNSQHRLLKYTGNDPSLGPSVFDDSKDDERGLRMLFCVRVSYAGVALGWGLIMYSQYVRE